jgi:hypothetical protein
VKFGDTPQALLYPRPRPDDRCPAPIEVPVEQLESYVKVSAEDDDDGRLNPYVKADLYWPIDLCRNGVELIDTPGLDEMNQAREEETIAYLPKVDAVVMVLDAQQAATRSEITFFQDIVQPLGHEDAFWVVNKINLVEDDRGLVQRAVERALKPLVHNEGRIFYIDARGALRAKISQDTEQLRTSGLPEVESSLEDFLTLHRGRSKVLVPVRQLQQSTREVRESIRVEEDLLSNDHTELVEKAHRMEVPLARLEKSARYLVTELEGRLADLTDEVDRAAASYFDGLTERVPGLLNEVSAETELALSPGRFQASVKQVTSELILGLQSSIQRDITQWRKNELATTVKTRLDAIQHAIRDDVRDFENDLRGLRLDLSAAAKHPAANEEVTITTSAFPEGLKVDLARAGIGTAAGSVIAGGAAAFAAAMVVGFLGLSAIAPFVIIPATLWAVSAVLKESSPRDKLLKMIRKRIAAGAVEQLRGHVPSLVSQIHDTADQQFSALIADFRSALTAQVDGLRQQLELALAARAHGETRVQARRSAITGELAELRSIEEELDTVVDRVLTLDGDSPTSDQGARTVRA